MPSPMMFLPHYIPPPGYSSAYSPYFRSAQGKVAELRLELSSGGKKDKNHAAKKIALKKIVANMTMSNNDMVALFPDIVGCMEIPSLEIKKMLVPVDVWREVCMLTKRQVLLVPRELCSVKARSCVEGATYSPRGTVNRDPYFCPKVLTHAYRI